MQKRPLGRTGYQITPVTFGGIIVMNETPQDAARYVSCAIDHGINYFDVAPSYGDAEQKLGPALTPYRQQVYLACKTEKRDAASAEAELHRSLKLLRTDHFDVYQLHAMTTQQDLDRAFAEDGVMPLLVRAREQGLIRRIGITAHNEDVALTALSRFDFDTVMFPVNWALGLSRGWADRLTKACREQGRGLLAIKALAHRKWLEGETRVYPKSWCKTLFGDEALMKAAMRYTLSKGADALIPPGNFEQFSFMVEHIEECLAQPLGEDDRTLLSAALPEAKAHPIFG